MELIFKRTYSLENDMFIAGVDSKDTVTVTQHVPSSVEQGRDDTCYPCLAPMLERKRCWE